MSNAEIDIKAITPAIRNAVADALGYSVEANVIAFAASKYKDLRFTDLNRMLVEENEKFSADGGRGIERATIIDDLRMVIAMRRVSDLDNIIARIKKFQALGAKNTNENEMKAAAAAAEKLITEYRITQAMLEADQVIPSEAFKDEDILCQGRRQQYIEALLQGLCDHFGGSFYLYSRRDHNNKGECRYTCVARISDWDTIHYFLNYLIPEIEQLAKKAGKLNTATRTLEGRETSKGDAIAFGNAFRSGCSEGIVSLFRDLRENAKKLAQASGTSAAIVLLDKRAKEARDHMNNTHRLGRASSVSGGRSSSARAKGYAAGRNVNINR